MWDETSLLSVVRHALKEHVEQQLFIGNNTMRIFPQCTFDIRRQ